MIADIPHLRDIDGYIIQAKKRKSPGIDGLPPKIYQIDSAASAKIL